MGFEISKELFPDKQRIFKWIEEICSQPHRRTGTEESRITREYLMDYFRSIGLEKVEEVEAESILFDASDYELIVDGEDIPCFMINGTLHREEFGSFKTGVECEDVELVFLGEGREEDFEGVDIKGKIVLCECPWNDMSETEYAEVWCSGGAIVYDPDAENREVLRKTDSYSPNAWPYNYIMAQKAGAAGFVGVLKDYFADGVNWNEDYTEIGESLGCPRFELPGLWIGTEAYAKVKKHLENDTVKATLRLSTRHSEGKATDVYGILPGMTDEYILVHSHYDAVFNGAVQDASGMSEIMAIAKYYSSIPKEQRRKSLIFAAFDGHYTDYAGHQKFIESKLAEGMNITADVVVEHIGKEVGIGENNIPEVRECPELRLLYVTKEGNHVDMVDEIIRKYDIRRTIIMPVNHYVAPENGMYEFQQDEVISDGYYSYVNGIPVISILSPQLYLFHPMDKPDMIPQDELVPVGMAFAEIVGRLMEE